MVNRFPLWKNLLISLVLLLGVLYALPNLFGEDPSLQISIPRAGTMDAAAVADIRRVLEGGGFAIKAMETENDRLLVRMYDTEAQLKARDALNQAYPERFTVALNLAPATPDWLDAFGARPMYLGLDLRGGVHFLLQVDMEAAVDRTIENYVDEFRTTLRSARIRYESVERSRNAVTVVLNDRSAFAQAYDLLRKEFNTMDFQDDLDKLQVVARLTPAGEQEIRRNAVQQNLLTLRNRVNELGVSEPVIQQQGAEQIVVQLPGVQDTARAKEILGATATLEFRLADTEHEVSGAVEGRVPPGSKLYRERNGNPILLKRQIIVTGNQIVDASSGIEQESGRAAVFVTLNAAGARKMGAVTRENIGKPMAVVYIENKTETRQVDGKTVRQKKTVEEVINVATIRDQFTKRFQITGLDSPQEARNLALLLRSGALAAPIDIVEERTVGPSLGKENIRQGGNSALIGFGLVVLFMMFYYRVFGVVASLAVGLNLVLIIAALSVLQATLTLPGIAGIALTVGMAVDANVLINERIREEVRNKNSPQASIYAGYEKAYATIFDANITTLIAALALFLIGSGPIKGFAVVLSIGILTSMFTGVTVTRMFINWIYGGRRVTKLWI